MNSLDMTLMLIDSAADGGLLRFWMILEVIFIYFSVFKNLIVLEFRTKLYFCTKTAKIVASGAK